MDRLGEQMELGLKSVNRTVAFGSSNHKFITYRKYFLIVNSIKRYRIPENSNTKVGSLQKGNIACCRQILFFSLYCQINKLISPVAARQATPSLIV
jgi:hypothetical protein